jgi:hypothetical protein
MKIKLTVHLSNNSYATDRSIAKELGKDTQDIWVRYVVKNNGSYLMERTATFTKKLDKSYRYVYLTEKDGEYNIRLSNTAYSNGDKLSGEIIVDFIFGD